MKNNTINNHRVTFFTSSKTYSTKPFSVPFIILLPPVVKYFKQISLRLVMNCSFFNFLENILTCSFHADYSCRLFLESLQTGVDSSIEPLNIISSRCELMKSQRKPCKIICLILKINCRYCSQ